MIYSRNNHCRQLKILTLLVSALIVSCGDCVIAQIKPDSTLGTESSKVEPTEPMVEQIDGGAVRGKNLFHSFEQFSVLTNGEARFNNDSGIQNIITRVTGSSASSIDGLIRANGTANLLLINPNGIIFGSGAALRIGGSFLASTANRINFADDSNFSATDVQPGSLLTISVPIGLQFGETAKPILNQSQSSTDGAINSLRRPVGLQVQTGRTLAFVGGDILLRGGNMTAAAGRIELGSVAGNSLVVLNPIEKGWALKYDKVPSFQDIEINAKNVAGVEIASFIDTSSLRESSLSISSGEIQVQGRHVMLADGSRILATNRGIQPGGNLQVNALNSLELTGDRTVLTTEARGSGNAGNLMINTQKLIVEDGAQITTSSSGKGSGGELNVTASESVVLSGTSLDGIFSGLISATSAAGDAGSLTINTRTLLLEGGARVTTETSGVEDAFGNFTPATGKGGNLIVNASEFVDLNGASPDGSLSGLSASTEGTGNAGDIQINTRNLTIQSGAQINVSSTGTGNAGNLDITAKSTRVENGGKITATSKLGSGGGNINLQNLELLTVSNGSEISTTAKGAGNGGNINIDTDNLVLAESSNITASAVEGRGGNISITTQGLFVSPDSIIDASSDRGIDGVVEIRRPDVDPSAELVILPANVVDVSGLIAQGCSVGSIASGESSFAITGRGGLPSTPAEATRSESILADLGITEKSKVRSQKSKTIPTPDERLPTPAEISNKVNPAPLVEATGWVIGSNGEVVLTASATNDTLNIPWIRPNSCNGT